MAITCAFNTSVSTLDFKYCLGRKTGTNVANVTNAVDGTAIGGRAVVFDNAANFQQLVWDGAINLPNSRVISVLIRFAPDYTGTPASRRVIWGMGNCVGGTNPGHLELYHDLTTGNLVAHARNEAGTAAINFGSFGAWSPTQDVWYDIVFVWDGTTTANAVKLYIDNSLFGQQTASAALTSSWTNLFRRAINIGATITGTTSDAKMNEFVISDNTTDLVGTVNLESGTGTLNGASRTSFFSDVAGSALTSFEGNAWTALAASKIQTGETQTQAGLLVTGTYTGADRNTSPAESEVKLNVQWKSNSTTNNKTGTRTDAAINKVETGYQYGAGGTEFTGTGGTFGGGSGGGYIRRR